MTHKKFYLNVVNDEFEKTVKIAARNVDERKMIEYTNFPISMLQGIDDIDEIFAEPVRIDERGVYRVWAMNANEIEFHFVELTLNPVNVGGNDEVEIFEQIIDEFLVHVWGERVACLSITCNWDSDAFTPRKLHLTDIDEPRTADKIAERGVNFVNDLYHTSIYVTARVVAKIHGGESHDWEYVGQAANCVWRNVHTDNRVSISYNDAANYIVNEL